MLAASQAKARQRVTHYPSEQNGIRILVGVWIGKAISITHKATANPY
jgi:hypothetical protein